METNGRPQDPKKMCAVAGCYATSFNGGRPWLCESHCNPADDQPQDLADVAELQAQLKAADAFTLEQAKLFQRITQQRDAAIVDSRGYQAAKDEIAAQRDAAMEQVRALVEAGERVANVRTQIEARRIMLKAIASIKDFIPTAPPSPR